MSFLSANVFTPLPPNMDTWAGAVRLDNESNDTAVHMNHTVLSTFTAAPSNFFEDSSAVRGINPADEVDASSKKVCFSKNVKVFEVTDNLDEIPVRVRFDDDIVNISDDVMSTSLVVRDPRTPVSPSKKRVRFSCLKQPKRPLSHGLSLLQMLKRRTLGPMPTSVTSKKHVRFGALKCQKVNFPDLSFGHRDSEWDEAETRRIFKRECMKTRGLQPLSSVNEAGAEDDWDST